MTVLDLDPVLATLAPVRRALLEDATAEGERLVAAATADAHDVVAAARADVDEAVERARHKAAAAAAARRERELATARRDAHGMILAERAALRRSLIDRVHAAVAALPDDPRYPELVDRLVRLARDQLGDDAVVTDDPDGGFVASVGPRRVDYRLAALADRAVDAAAEEVAGLWS
jgi:vacuolar-type H+-ATPase subunit E/Vma4